LDPITFLYLQNFPISNKLKEGIICARVGQWTIYPSSYSTLGSGSGLGDWDGTRDHTIPM